MASFLPQTLDIDNKIIDRNLRIVQGLDEPPISKPSKISDLLPGGVGDYPSVQVTPVPGLCVKTKNVNGDKVFINLCKIAEIPPPPPLTEAALCDIIAKDDYQSPYRVPMSLGAPRKEEDKGGNPCWSSDVAINYNWFDEVMESSLVFTTFVINLALEGLCDKYGDVVNCDRNEWNILKNKKYLGKIQRHCIQRRKQKISDVGDINETKLKKNLIQEVSKVPKYKIIREPAEGRAEFLVVTVELNGVKKSRDISTEVGEDRIVVEANESNYLLDVFVPFVCNPDETVAQFHRDSQILTVTIPVIS